MSKTLKVNEIFRSLQGEGLYQGEPTVFVRTQGCNLRCPWCDTQYARNPDGGKVLRIEDIIKEVVSKQKEGWVCITGGEPLMQDEAVGELVGILWEEGYKVEIETNGFYPLPYWHSRAHSWALDVKCPSSGKSPLPAIVETWEELTSSSLQVKFVVKVPRDLNFVLEVKNKKLFNGKMFIISPVFIKGKLDNGWGQTVAQFCLDNNFRLSLQYHKILWGDKRGV